MVIIENLKFPNSCSECKFNNGGTCCIISNRIITSNLFRAKGKLEDCPLVEAGWTRPREEVIAKIDEYLKLPIERQLEPINIGFYNALRWMVDEDESR